MPSFLIPVLLFVSATLQAHDYGTFGTSYPIQERNILEYIRERLLNASNEERELFTKRQIQMIKEPKPLSLPNAANYRSFFYDPTVFVKEEINDLESNIIVKKGSRYNPLEHYSLNNNLLFFDATQESHLAWAKATEGSWILVKGKPLELEEQEGRPVYFDQFGELIARFKIKALPAKVSQEGKYLKIEEFALREKECY